MDCPICYETICPTVNFLKTECGHEFHTSCLLQNVSHNGYGCPLCRNELVETNVDNTEYETDDGYTVSNYDFGNYEEDDEYALRGLRMFMNRVEGFAPEREDEVDEAIEFSNTPSADFIVDQLILEGTSIHELVISLLALNNEFSLEEDLQEEYAEILDKTAAKMRKAIEMYKSQCETMRDVLA